MLPYFIVNFLSINPNLKFIICSIYGSKYLISLQSVDGCGRNPEKATLCKINFYFVPFPCPENVTVPLWRFALISIPVHAGTSRQHPSSSHPFFQLSSGQEPPSLQPSALVTLQPLPDPHLYPPEAKGSFSQSFSEFEGANIWVQRLTMQAQD